MVEGEHTFLSIKELLKKIHVDEIYAKGTVTKNNAIKPFKQIEGGTVFQPEAQSAAIMRQLLGMMKHLSQLQQSFAPVHLLLG